jgi:hypothetical protein
VASADVLGGGQDEQGGLGIEVAGPTLLHGGSVGGEDLGPVRSVVRQSLGVGFEQRTSRRGLGISHA